MSQPAAAATGRYTIQQVSARSGLSEPTLRDYERIGLIDPVGRDPGAAEQRAVADLEQAARELS